MLGEYFVDSCILFCLSEDVQWSEHKNSFLQIREIIDWYVKEVPEGDYPTEFKIKLEFLEYIIRFRNRARGNYRFEDLKEKVKLGKFEAILFYMEEKSIHLTQDEINKIIQFITNRARLCKLLQGKSGIEDVLRRIETSDFSDEDEIIQLWESHISRLYDNIMELKREETRKKVEILDLLDDDYTPVIEDIRKIHSNTNVLHTGFSNIDDLLPTGGLEKRRLYLIGGTSGIGKSIMLVNLAVNMAMSKSEFSEGTYLYLTGENMISETLERVYCCMTGMPYKEMIHKIKNDPSFNMEHHLKTLLKQSKGRIIICYFSMTGTKLADIESIISEIAKQHNDLKCVFIDYLDLIQSGLGNFDIRIDQGLVSKGLKGIAVKYDIPVVTATQLNRSGYDESKEPSLTQMGESMLKVNDSDFVLYLQPTSNPWFNYQAEAKGGHVYTMVAKKIRMTVLKNRNGEVGRSTLLMLHERMIDHAGEERKLFNYKFLEIPKELLEKLNSENGDNGQQDPSQSTTSGGGSTVTFDDIIDTKLSKEEKENFKRIIVGYDVQTFGRVYDDDTGTMIVRDNPRFDDPSSDESKSTEKVNGHSHERVEIRYSMDDSIKVTPPDSEPDHTQPIDTNGMEIDTIQPDEHVEPEQKGEEHIKDIMDHEDPSPPQNGDPEEGEW